MLMSRIQLRGRVERNTLMYTYLVCTCSGYFRRSGGTVLLGDVEENQRGR